ncbi:APC family permease [Tsukamurella sp. 8F]|uniref:APC family permease n=1 Tax=unclassified Tsukamurella TaxID=2633480 RepID=UPI0023BA14CC|nr:MULTISPECIES: APC family permease [unclassified Tsukamurella]MDF0531347.1 APC family permease [Tsukamurella sp. 8J]MDF0588553.1 APC family permease [Tsukamurella sp. 8F]
MAIGTQVPVRRLGYWSVVLLGINAIIGAGIFLTPGDVIKAAGSGAPLAYLIAAAFALVLAMVFATAARFVTTNGASYAYTKAGLGERPAIYVGVTHAFTAAIAWGTLASFVVTTFLQVAFPHRTWSKDTGLWSVKTLVFVVFILILLAINYFGNAAVAWANGISTVAKVAALAVFVIAAVVLVASRGTSSYHLADRPPVHTGNGTYSLLGYLPLGSSDFASIVLAVIVALYAYTGFESIANAAEEMHEPDKTLPRAIPVAVSIVAVAYLAAIVAGMLLAPDKIATSDETVRLAAAISNNAVHAVIVVGALVSMFGINVAASFGSPRLFTALADNGLLPHVLSKKGRFGVPLFAFGVTAVLALAFPLSLGYDTSSLTGLAVIARFVQYLIVPIAVWRLASSADVRWAGVRTGLLTGRVLPVAAFVFSLFLLVSFNFKSIFEHAGGGANVLSIALLLIGFVLVPALAYVADARRRA